MRRVAVLAFASALFLALASALVASASIPTDIEKAIRMADNILSWQNEHGGWDKNKDFTERPRDPDEPLPRLGTFDNNATIPELRFLAYVYAATGLERFREGFYRGLDFILEAQYPSGGWPQFYPRRGNYSDYVTFNDGAMMNVMNFIKDVLTDSLYSFVAPDYLARLQVALDKGIEYIVKSQIRVGDRLTAWCAQHDPVTYEPRPARSYEHVSISGGESVGIVQFLMGLSDPSIEVRRAILSALLWFEEAELPGGRWARFYEIGTNRPIFSGRDGIIKYDIMEIERERRENYSWFSTGARSLLPRARLSGYMEELFESLPDYPVPFIKLNYPQIQGSVATGVLPVDVQVLCKPDVELTRLSVFLDDMCVYSGPRQPGDKILIDISGLANGYHTLRVSVDYDQDNRIDLSGSFSVDNTWTLVQEFRPPADFGWFGTLEDLQTHDRSAGWEYATEASDVFGDEHRLTNAVPGRQYLTWETPGLVAIEGTVFVKAGLRLDEALEVSVLGSDGSWRMLPYSVLTETLGNGWAEAKVVINLAAPDITLCRLATREGVPPGSLQLGRFEFQGRKFTD